MATLVRAAWLLPIVSPPVRKGWVVADGGRIAAVGGPGEAPPRDVAEVVEAHSAAVLPGLVNAHTHLELSWMRGLVPPASSQPDWASQLMDLRRQRGQDDERPIGPAIRDASATGTALVGDVSNGTATVAALADGPLHATVFHEVLGFRGDAARRIARAAREQIATLVQTDRVRVSLAAHAPYSTSPALVREVRALVPAGMPMSMHLGESAEEVEFLASGRGAWREVLDRVGTWDPAWDVPGCGPVEYAERLGVLGPDFVAVHGVQLGTSELARLGAAGATLVTCPRSNARTGAGEPPVEAFYSSAVRVAVGTDSLASVQDLNLFNELAELRRLAPRVPAAALLRSATVVGADALGWHGELGVIVPGARAALLAVDLPKDARDVEEELVQGVTPDRIRWLADAPRRPVLASGLPALASRPLPGS